MCVCVYNVVGKKKLLANLTVKRTQTQVCVCVFVCVCVCVCVCVFVAKTTNKFCTRYVTNMREIIFAILTIFIFVSSLHDIIFKSFRLLFLLWSIFQSSAPSPLFFILKRFYILWAPTHCVFGPLHMLSYIQEYLQEGKLLVSIGTFFLNNMTS